MTGRPGLPMADPLLPEPGLSGQGMAAPRKPEAGISDPGTLAPETPASRLPDRFTSRRLEWRPRKPAQTAIPGPVSVPAVETDPVAFLPAVLAGDAGPVLAASAGFLARRRGAGLAQGEPDLAATAVARRIGCFFTTAAHARRAAAGLRRKREVEVLLEEGLPSPLGGRSGGVIAAASALAAIPVRASRQVFWTLEEEKLDDQEITDLILVAGFAAWNARLALAAGESLRLDPEDRRSVSP